MSKQAQFVGTGLSHGTASRVMVAQGAVTTCTLAGVKGTYRFYGGDYVIGSGVEQLAGQIVLDGTGNVGGMSTAVVAENVVCGDLTGTYTVASNSTGTLTLTWSSTRHSSNMVVPGGGKGFSAIVSDSSSVTTVIAHQGSSS